MDKMEKYDYEAPSTRVFEVRQEGVICVSVDSGLDDYTWNTPVEE